MYGLCSVCHKRRVLVYAFPEDEADALVWAKRMLWEEQFKAELKRNIVLWKIFVCQDHFDDKMFILDERGRKSRLVFNAKPKLVKRVKIETNFSSEKKPTSSVNQRNTVPLGEFTDHTKGDEFFLLSSDQLRAFVKVSGCPKCGTRDVHRVLRSYGPTALVTYICNDCNLRIEWNSAGLLNEGQNIYEVSPDNFDNQPN